MRTEEKDKLRLTVNPSLTLAGIPLEAFDYPLGNRSALEWVIDQYQVSADKRSGITSVPNGADDPEYIVRLVGQVIRVMTVRKSSVAWRSSSNPMMASRDSPPRKFKILARQPLFWANRDVYVCYNTPVREIIVHGPPVQSDNRPQTPTHPSNPR